MSGLMFAVRYIVSLSVLLLVAHESCLLKDSLDFLDYLTSPLLLVHETLSIVFLLNYWIVRKTRFIFQNFLVLLVFLGSANPH